MAGDGEFDYSDVEPLAQDEGPAPVVRIKYTARFEEVMGLFRALLASGELSERALRATEEVIDLNAANYTAWVYRRRCLGSLASEALWERELKWSADVTRDNPKNYQVWFHRRRCVEARRAGSDSELEFIAECLQDDAKNYHAWGYRQWVLKTYDLWENELAYTAALLDDDAYNNSAWNQRHFVLAETGQLGDGGAVLRELDFALGHVAADPSNSAPWAYVRGLLPEPGTEPPTPDGAQALARVTARCRELRATHPQCAEVAAALVDACERMGGADACGEASRLCRELSTDLDQIRAKYWAMRSEQLASAARVAAATDP